MECAAAACSQIILEAAQLYFPGVRYYTSAIFVDDVTPLHCSLAVVRHKLIIKKSRHLHSWDWAASHDKTRTTDSMQGDEMKTAAWGVCSSETFQTFLWTMIGSHSPPVDCYLLEQGDVKNPLDQTNMCIE